MVLSKLFEQIVLLSIEGSVLAIFILFIKAILRKKLSAKFHYYIWFVLILRLIIPFNFQNSLSMFNFASRYQQTFDLQATVEQSIPNITASQQNANTIPKNTVSKDDNNSSVKTQDIGFNFQTAALIWIAGVLAILLYIISVNILLFIRLKKYPQCENKDVIEVFENSRSKLKVASRISIIHDSNLKSPAVYGLIRPKILISEDIIQRLTPEELNFVFLHEITHIKRKDLLVNIAVMLTQVIYWFNPVIWYSLYQMKQDCEMACDATAIAVLNSEEIKKYGNTIINMLQILSESHWIPGTLGFASKYNTRRIIMISLFKKTSIMWAVPALTITLLVGCSSLSKPTNVSTTSTKNLNEVTDAANDSKASTKDDVPSTSVTSDTDSGNNSGSSVQEEDASQQALLTNIKDLANQGKIINCEFPVKSITIEDVEKKWGNPDKTDWVPKAKGNYATYSKHNVVFGFNKGEQIFEARSFESELGKISMPMVKKAFGSPVYDVKSNGQEIIGYTAGELYKIEFVFPEPTSSNSNPLLDHYLVLYPRGTVNSMADDPGRQW